MKIRSSPSPEGKWISNCNESKGGGWRRARGTAGWWRGQEARLHAVRQQESPVHPGELMLPAEIMSTWSWWPCNWGRQVETWLNAAGRGQSQSQDEVVYTQSQSDTHTSVAKPWWSHNPVVWGGFLIVWHCVTLSSHISARLEACLQKQV